MKFKKIIIVFLGFCQSILPSEFMDSGTWFAEKKDFRNGREFIQLVLHKNKFILAKLSFNEERNWEETRIQGIFQEEKGEISFKPEMCTVYATNKLGLRWILIQAFDCDHLKFQITKTEQGILLSPSFGISEDEILKQNLQKASNEIPAILVSKEEEIVHAWSLAIRFLRKGSTATLNGKPVKVLETVDSTCKISVNGNVEIGDKIQLHNPTASNLFE